MTRRKSVCLKWTLVLFIVVFCPFVYTRPQETATVISSTSSVQTGKSTETPIRESSSERPDTEKKPEEPTTPAAATPNAPRNVKTKGPVIGESIKMVASQLLENPSNTTVQAPIVADTRIPPKLKSQLAQKHKIKTRQEDGDEPAENSHAGIAVPVTMEELETENKISDIPNESSTTNQGISTWVLLSNPVNKENVTTEPTKIEESQKKKPNASKNKTKRPPNNKVSIGKRPIIGSTNKSDLVAGGSAINENVFNKIKDTVLSNVQKNKNTSAQRITTTTTTTTTAPTTEILTTKNDVTKAPSSVIPVIKVTAKPAKKKTKPKQKVSTTTIVPVSNESALLPMEPKEQEIELEISTPATTTKKPKRSSTRKKTKTKKRKTSKKPDTATNVSELKNSNKTKTKTSKKPITSLTGPITSQLYSYFSREVMPTVGVGMLGLASLVGLAGYFLYPFSTPVRRTFEVDKKDDIYRHNAEEYASEGNGQAEEEMLGTVLAGMPAHSKHKLNPYAGQTSHINRYPVKKEQDLRYRHVATKYEPNYNVHYPQQKTGIAHGAVFPEPINYNPHYQYENRHAYTTESKYIYDKGPAAYTPQPAVEPIYAAPQTGPSAISSYGNEASKVVYGVKPSSDSDFKPVYPFEGQFYSETTNSPMTYPPTSMYLGSNDESEIREENRYADNGNENDESDDNKFVVGNVPKELVDSATPAVVPEHGPRNLNRRKRSALPYKRSVLGTIEQILREEKEKNKDIFISNEVDEVIGLPIKNLAMEESSPLKNDIISMPDPKDIYTVYPVSIDSTKEDKTTDTTTIIKTDIVESVSTIPIENTKQEKTTTESDLLNELETTTKTFKVYEVFSSDDTGMDPSSPVIKSETTTQLKNMNTETTTELKSETTSTLPPSPSPISDPKDPITTTTNNPEVLTYPPLNQDSGFFTFLKRLIEFKYRLGLSILQTTSDNLNRYLRNMENTVQKVARASSP